MDITVKLDNSLTGNDTGGGYRESQGQIYIDARCHERLQKLTVIYETLGLLLDKALSHETLETLADYILDGLEQLESEREKNL